MICSLRKTVQIFLCILIMSQISDSAQHHHHQRHKKSIENGLNPVKKVDIMVTIKSRGQNVFQTKMEVTPPPTIPECTPSPPECATTPPPVTTCKLNPTIPETFTCTKPGTFPNPDSCSDFYVCHQNGGSGGLQRVKLSCPSGLAFDRVSSQCTKRAAAECLSH